MRIKKHLAIALTLAFLCAFFGCGEQNANDYIYLPKTELHTLNETSGFEREYKHTYKYDDHGNVTTEKYYEKGNWFYRLGSRSDTTYTYDENGKKTDEKIRAEYFSTNVTDTHFVSETVYKFIYNQNGQLEKREIVSGKDTEPRAYKYEYDERGNLTKETERYSDGTEKLITEYEYDSNNQKIKKIEYTHSDTLDSSYISRQTDYAYKDGRLTYSKISSYYLTVSYYKTEMKHYTEENYHYDKLGRLVKKQATSFDKDGTKTREEAWEYKNFVKLDKREA